MPKNSRFTTATTERSASGRQRKRSLPHPTQPDSNAAEPASTSDPLSQDLLEKMDAYWRTANYLSVGQIYLQDNPLLEMPLEREHIKARLLGHWGTTSGLNFIYVHLNHDNFHVHGYREEGTTTTPFDMVVLNNLDRYQLALDAIRYVPRLSGEVQKATDRYWTTMERHRLYVSEHGQDMPEVRDWRWSAATK
jgi:phosphoketolase